MPSDLPRREFNIELLPVITNLVVTAPYFLSGGHGDVHLGRMIIPAENESSVSTQIQIAIKTFKSPNQGYITEEEEKHIAHRLRREFWLWHKMNHDNILPVLGLCRPNDRLRSPGLVSPFREAGDVKRYLGNFPHADRLAIIKDVARGLTYLHEHGIVHGDLSLRNILINIVNNRPVAQICDFGRSRVLLEEGYTTPINTVCRYIAPEVMVADESDSLNKLLTKESDVYTFGMVILEILSGQRPFHSKADTQVVILVGHEKRKPSREHHSIPPYANGCWPIIESCWARDPRERRKMVDVYRMLLNL